MTERGDGAVPPWERLGCQRAHALAVRLHEGQVNPWARLTEHTERVAWHLARLFPDAPMAKVQAALLHDLLRDTAATLGILAGSGVDAEALGIVLQPTPRGPGSYEERIAAIARGNIGAIRVKLGAPGAASGPAQLQWEQAWAVLEKTLAREEGALSGP